LNSELPAPREEEEEEEVVSCDSPAPSPDSPEDLKIVTLVEEEDEEPRQSTVTLMEEEEAEEEEKREADRNQWESQTYCPLSSFSLSFSCVATLPELLHRWCSARLAKERLRSLRRRQGSTRTQTHAASLAYTAPPSPAPAATPLKEAAPLAEKTPEAPVEGAGRTSDEAPERAIELEPSRTAAIPPHSFSDAHGSLASPTPSHEEKPLPPVMDAGVDPAPTPPLPAVTVPETQQAGASAAPPGIFPTLATASETASPGVVAPPHKELQSLPTASRPEDLIPPPTELPAAFPPPAAHADAAAKLGADGVQPSQTHGEHGDSLAAAGEPHRAEEAAADDDLLGANGNGNVHRIATDFYAELQNGGDYNGGVAAVGNGNGAVHGSSQKESVFMRLNNRIKSLEMNMSLSGRYLEELSQR